MVIVTICTENSLRSACCWWSLDGASISRRALLSQYINTIDILTYQNMRTSMQGSDFIGPNALPYRVKQWSTSQKYNHPSIIYVVHCVNFL